MNIGGLMCGMLAELTDSCGHIVVVNASVGWRLHENIGIRWRIDIDEDVDRALTKTALFLSFAGFLTQVVSS